MKRRAFISSLCGQAAALSLVPSAWAMGEDRAGGDYSVSRHNTKRLTKIGERSLEDIRDVFASELFDKTIPFWKEHGVDWEYGGYLPYVDDRGEVTSYDKKLYHQGRVLWLYSYFYNHFDRDEILLRAARSGYDFLTKYCMAPNYDWFTTVKRDGTPVTKFDDIYASIYMILGLGEYYRATGHEEARELAVRTAYRVTEIIVSPHYQAQGHGPAYEPGSRRLGTWLHFLSTLTPLLKYTADERIEKIARMCVRNILRYHWQPDLGLAFELLDRDYKPYPVDYLSARFTPGDDGQHNIAGAVNNFHSIQAPWMCMDEALRVGQPEMFVESMRFGRSHLEKCWVRKESGEEGLAFIWRPYDDEPFWEGRIVLPYVNREIFVLTLLALEHSLEDWAAEWFDKAFTNAYDNNLPWPWADTLHQPRGVMFCYEILNRMIERDGRASDFLDDV